MSYPLRFWDDPYLLKMVFLLIGQEAYVVNIFLLRTSVRTWVLYLLTRGIHIFTLDSCGRYIKDIPARDIFLSHQGNFTIMDEVQEDVHSLVQSHGIVSKVTACGHGCLLLDSTSVQCNKNCRNVIESSLLHLCAKAMLLRKVMFQFLYSRVCGIFKHGYGLMSIYLFPGLFNG